MKKIFNNLKIAVLFASVISLEVFKEKSAVILSDDLKADIKKIKEPFIVVVRGVDKQEYKDVTEVRHKFSDNDTEKVNVFSQSYVKEIAGDKATFYIDGAYGFAVVNPKSKAVKDVEVPPPEEKTDKNPKK